MSPSRAMLEEVLGPVRDVHVAEIMTALADQLQKGANVDAEPVDRDAEGRVSRGPPLGLPRRRDLCVRQAGRQLMVRADAMRTVNFEPISVSVSDVASAQIAPFFWGDAVVRVGGAPGMPNWRPLRLWFLEWFQARFGEESPDLLGVAHALEGPFAEPDGWSFRVDLGSASVGCFEAMLDAYGASGCRDIRVGETAAAH